MTIQMTQNELNVLAHVVLDPDAWVAHVEATFENPRDVLEAKVTKWQADYDASVARDGANYKNRAQIESEAL